MSTPAARAAQASELGALLSDHPQVVVGSRGRMIQTAIALGLGAIMLLGGGVAFALMPSGAGQSALLCLGFGGFCLLGIGLLGLGDARRTLDMSLQLYERGLHYADRRGQKTWLWADVAELWHRRVRIQSSGIVRHGYQLTHRSGDTLLFGDHVRDPAGAYAAICGQVYPLLLPGLAAAFDAGAPLQFGPIRLDQAGVQVRRRSIAWAELADARVGDGTLFLDKRGGGWFNDATIEIGEVPNLELLLQLIGRRRGR